MKRSAPGGHGYVVDPFESSSNLAHAEKFKEIFSRPENRGIVRAFFNDSYEFYGVNFTDAFYEEFERRRGYDFRPYAREIFAQSPKASLNAENSVSPTDPETSARKNPRGYGRTTTRRYPTCFSTT